MKVSDIVNYHETCKETLNTTMTVALVPVKREEATRFGVALLEESQGFKLVRGFAEKPSLEDAPQVPWINAGIYVIHGSFVLPQIDSFLPEQPETNLEKTLLERLALWNKDSTGLANDQKPKLAPWNRYSTGLAAYLLDLEAWFDVGTLEQLVDTNLYIASKKDYGDENR